MRLALAFVLALPLAACATSQDYMVEQGFPRGSLAVAAIERADYATAERLLEQSPLERENPARLINLGRVYMATGRRTQAISVWQQALAVSAYHDVALSDGRQVRARDAARELLVAHGVQLATR